MEEAWRIVEELGSRALEEAWRISSEWRITTPAVKKAFRRFKAGWRDLARPAIVALSCRAVGGDVERAFKAAAPLILLSGGFDLHDDIIDRSTVRGPRRKKTILGRYGQEVTMLLGDALLVGGAWILAPTLLNLGLSEVEIREIMKLIFELGDAEALELSFVRRLDVTPLQYLKMVWSKAADVEAYARLGGFIGGGSKAQCEALASFGRRLGMIAIIRDDLEDLLYYQTELKNRILYESLPLPVLKALRSRKASDALRALLTKDELSVEELREVVKLTRRGGGIKYTLKVLSQLISEADQALNQVGGDVNDLRIILRAAVPPLIEQHYS